MSRQPREPLTPEERALAAALPRLHGRVEPDARMDARILAAARSAAAPMPARRPRRVWIVPLAVAASLSLAVGLAWRLQPPPAPGADESMADAAAVDARASRAPASMSDAMPEAQVKPAPPATRPSQNVATVRPEPQAASSAPQRMAAPASSPATEVAVAAVPDMELGSSAQRSANAGMAAAPAGAPPAAPAAPSLPVAAKAGRSTGSAREPPAASTGAAAAAAPLNEAMRAADASTGDPQAFIGDEDVPPATVDSPEVRDAWLRRIAELLQQGRSQDARASLGEFRRRYPDAPLPPELRKLDPP